MWPWIPPVILVAVVGTVEARRGPAAPVLDLVGVYLGMWAAGAGYEGMAKAFSFLGSTGSVIAGYWFLMLLVFAIFGAAGYFVNRAGTFTLESWDSIIGGAAGAIAGLVLSHAFYKSIVLAVPADAGVALVIHNCWLSEELLTFRSWKWLVEKAHGFGRYEPY